MSLIMSAIVEPKQRHDCSRVVISALNNVQHCLYIDILHLDIAENNNLNTVLIILIFFIKTFPTLMN